jgi:hypothetical protein
MISRDGGSAPDRIENFQIRLGHHPQDPVVVSDNLGQRRASDKGDEQGQRDE